jgi:outer membrane protein assembly factor BamB
MAGDRLIGVHDRRVLYAIDIYGDSANPDKGKLIETAGSTAGAGFPYTCDPHLAAGPVVADGGLYFVEHRHLKGLRVTDGSVLPGWTDPPEVGRRVIGLAGFPGVVVVVERHAAAIDITAYRTSDAHVAWTSQGLRIGTPGVPGCSSDALFFVADNHLYRINSNFGDVSFPIVDDQHPLPPAAWFLDQSQAPLIGEKTVVCSGDNVYGFDRLKGMLSWSFVIAAGSDPVKWQSAMSPDQKWIAGLNSAGLLRVANAVTGEVNCELQIGHDGTLFFGGNMIYVVTPHNASLHKLEFDALGKQLLDRGLFSLGNAVGDITPTSGNGSIYLATQTGDWSDMPYEAVQAAYFDGTTNMLVTPDGDAFKFGTGDFTIEAWVRSSLGGEIVSSYPGDTSSHGFRFNVGPRGQIRFGVLGSTGANQDLVATDATIAADGYWHHVAASRKGALVSCYLDGISLPVSTLNIRNGVEVHANGNALHTQDGVDTSGNTVRAGQPVLNTPAAAPPPDPCAIDSPKGLTVGAYISAPNTPAVQAFKGLIRELRIWSLGLDASAIKNRMKKILPPTVEHLHGNWHLDTNKQGAFRLHNDVNLHEFDAQFDRGRSVTTDLALDDSAFPFLLHQSAPAWPYAESWIVRGEEAVEPGCPAAVSTDGIVCFTTNNRLYGVRKSDGARKWSLPFANTCSAPIAWEHAFYAMTSQFGMVRIDSQTGGLLEVEGFRQDSADRPAAPASDGHFLAAAMQSSIRVLDLTVPKATAVDYATGTGQGPVTVAGGVVYGVAGQKIFAIQPDGTRNSADVTSPVFCASGDRVYSVRNGKLIATDTLLGDALFTAATVDGADVTGLAADLDANLLVVATRSGELVGLGLQRLGFRWRTAIPEGSARNSVAKSLLTPCVSGRHVYCTTGSGMVTALDGRNGALRGRFLTPNRAVTAPVYDAGVLYFGCAQTAATQPLDGGLHSVIFGKTMAVRLGYNPATDAAATGYVKIKSRPAADAISLRNRSQCCVEAWVNSSSGGEVLSIRPSTGDGIGLRLWIEPVPDSVAGDGRIQFQLTYQNRGDSGWKRLRAQAVAHKALDGKWRHVAVSTEGPDKVRIYLDGQQQTVPTPTVESVAAPDSPDFVAYLGADASASTATSDQPANYFSGMIGEVRLWDTYLVANEISHRMQEKLRGDEPDLLAYWNFDTVEVHDGSRQGSDGDRAGDGAAFWLTDLPFQHPDYPYFRTEAKLRLGEAASTGHAATPDHYELTLTAHKGDDSPLPNTDVQFWYVRHAEIGEPEQITFLHGTESVTLTGIAPGAAEITDDARKMWTTKTDLTGAVIIQVDTSFLKHGPAFDVRAPEFMPLNERYHVDVLLNRQKLSKAAPPSLGVQSKLIQDYHWSPGSKIKDGRERPVYRTTITAFNADRSRRPYERFEVSSTGFAEVEHAGKRYSVTAENGHEFHADAEGEITLVMQADDLKPAVLKVWAGYMSPQECVTVNPADDAHEHLSRLQPEEMRTPRLKSWSKAGGAVRAPLLGDDKKDHAPNIAKAVRHVMLAGRGAAPAHNLRGTAGREPFADMTQRAPIPTGDTIRALRTMSHVNRRLPVTPESVLASMRRQHPGALGFEVSGDGSAVGFRYLASHEEVAEALKGRHPQPGPLPPRDTPMGSFLNDAWDSVKSAAETVADNARRIAVTVGEAVTVAIEKANSMVHMVVRSIEQAVEIVVEFLKKLALELIEIIKFLLMIFDFGAILAAHRILRDTFDGLGTFFRHTIGDGTPIKRGLAPVLKVLGMPVDDVAKPGGASTVEEVRANASQPHPLMAHANSVGARSAYSKFKEHQSDMVITGGAIAAVQPPGNMVGALTDFSIGVLELLPRLPSLSPSDAARALLQLAKGIAGGVVDALALAIEEAVKAAAAMMDEILGVLKQEIYIPFLSELYEWLTGDELTIFSLMCLMMAVVVHVAYLLMTGNEFGYDADAKKLPTYLRPQLQAAAAPSDEGIEDRPVLGAGRSMSYAQPDNRAMEAYYIMLRSMNMAMTLITDAMFARFVPAIPEHFPVRDEIKVFRGLFGMAASTVMFLCSAPDHADKVSREVRPGLFPNLDELLIENYYEKRNIAVFSVSILGDLLTFAGGVKGMYSAPPLARLEGHLMGAAARGGMNPSGLDQLECGFLAGRAVFLTGMIGWQTLHYSNAEEHTNAVSHGLRMGSKLLFIRDVLDHICKMPGFIFTRTAATKVPRPVYYAATATRLVTQTSAVVCHGVAEFQYLGN